MTAVPRTSFAERIAIAERHEQLVAAWMREHGWAVTRWGQGVFDEDFRRVIRRFPVHVRWLPDLAAIDPITGTFAWIDAKAEQRHDTANHAIEQDAHDAHLVTQAATRAALIYVFEDGHAASCAFIDRHGVRRRGSDNGSGTPFLLIPKARCPTLTQVLRDLTDPPAPDPVPLGLWGDA